MVFGKTIQIFLPDGNPRSIKIAEFTSRTLQSILIPRAKLNEVSNRTELQQCGAYFLIGSSDENSKPLIYIGQAEDTYSRLKNHNQNKDFWATAIAFTSKTKHLTRTHIQYLEWYCWTEANKANRYILENSNSPSKPYVSESMEADLHENFETIKLLVSTLGHPIFDEIAIPKKKEIIYCVQKNADAKGEYTEDGIVVFKGSKCNLIEAKSAKTSVRNKRKKLIEEGILHKVGEIYQFSSNYIFSSPSTAAGVVLAREANGWTEWKYENGKTLKEVHRQN